MTMGIDINLRSARQAVDRQVSAMASIRQPQTPPKGWIATIRVALGMPQDVLGARLRMPKQRVSQLEKREQSGDIKLSQLREVAEALNCDFVYALLPREPLEAVVERRSREIAKRQLSAVERTMQLEDQATGISEDRIRDYIARHISEKDLWRGG
jgi:predicted DNA-binding mobile mystery protein A